MMNFPANARSARQDHAACSGCNLCLLVCPVWRQTRDFSLTPHGRAKALQHGADIAAITASIESCTLCGACDPVCPEHIDLIGMIVELRRKLPQSSANQSLEKKMRAHAANAPATQPTARLMLLPGAALRNHAPTLARVAALLGKGGKLAVAHDDGWDIALALEAGAWIPEQRLEQFLAPLRPLKKIIVVDGLLLRHLKLWLPQSKIVALGEALTALDAVRRGLRATDMYVIEPRAYHADYERLVKYYDRLRVEAGCAFNLDLQRIAIPATARSLPQRLGLKPPDDGAHARWILHGHAITRIVVESLEDIAAFGSAGDCPVVHVADLADDEGQCEGTHAFS
jgi:NAD-dependent dihydropyrimidine dehydrogenase PreA subunit